MPISANSNASPANSDGPLANFGAFSAATDTYPGSPKPREPPPLFPISATHHQLNTLVPPTYSGPDPRSQLTPTHSVKLHQAPPPQPTYPEVLRYLPVLSQSPGLISVSQSYLSLPVLSQSPSLISVSRSYLSLPVLSCLHFAIILVIVSYLHLNLLLFHVISSDAVLVTPSDRCAQVFINLNDLTNSTITITNPDTPLPGPNLTLRSVPDSINSK
ncbi:hypothetical protein E4T56_gene19100 [Termitomyces sp. T112]|nr:hypothetical protein E4T56_gene19100 [Termitomyces sp. T112]